MPLKTTSLEAVPTIGIDIGKNTFHLIGLDKMGMASNPGSRLQRAGSIGSS